MNRSFEIIKQPRIKILEFISHLNIEQLNKVPDGFNNNIIWNLGHMIASQQGLCYKRSGLDTRVGEDFFNDYKSGSKPEKFVDEAGYEKIKELLVLTLEQLEADCNAQIFNAYSPVVTRYDVEVNNIDDAVQFLPFHDGLHSGYIMAMRKLV